MVSRYKLKTSFKTQFYMQQDLDIDIKHYIIFDQTGTAFKMYFRWANAQKYRFFRWKSLDVSEMHEHYLAY